MIVLVCFEVKCSLDLIDEKKKEKEKTLKNYWLLKKDFPKRQGVYNTPNIPHLEDKKSVQMKF